MYVQCTICMYVYEFWNLVNCFILQKRAELIFLINSVIILLGLYKDGMCNCVNLARTIISGEGTSLASSTSRFDGHYPKSYTATYHAPTPRSDTLIEVCRSD